MRKVPFQMLASYAARRIGSPGWVGLVALLVAGVYLVFQALPATNQLSKLDARAAAVQTKLTKQASGDELKPLSPTQQLLAFYGEFPQRVKVPDVLARMHEIATEQNLALDFGEYTYTKVEGGRLDQFRIGLPVKGAYPQVRKFMAAALLAHPTLSLESVSLRRDKLAENSVTGRLVFVLFLGHSP